jgi:LysM repeat protein
MSKHSIEIDEQLYLRAAAKAAKEGTDLVRMVEDNLRTWVGPEPAPPVITPPPTTTAPTEVKIYVIRPGDTLARIARDVYGDPKKYDLIAEYNGITNPAMIRVGQQLRIPLFEAVPPATEVTTGPTEIGTGPAPSGAQPLAQPFRFPLDKIETNYYKFGSLYASNSRWAGKPHPGVDFHEKKGASVHAIGEGTVLINKQDPTGYGHYIMIEHTLTTGGKVYSLYGHMMYDDEAFQSPLVGTKLRGRDIVIGKEGDTGYAGVPHVHFEIKKTSELGLYSMITTYNLNDYFYDPYTFIRDVSNLYVPV